MREEIEKICNEFGIENWSINSDGLVDVEGDALLNENGLEKLPLKFGKISGHFYCNNKLTTLEGAPREVGGHFSCEGNKLTTLEGAPGVVRGDFNCYNNKLTTLEGAPREVGGHFYCSDNKLTTLEGAPREVGGHFYCSENKLTTLEGAPRIVRGDFYCYRNPIYEQLGDIDYKAYITSLCRDEKLKELGL